MFKKTLAAALATLTLTSATLATASSAQAGFGKAVAAGIVGLAVGSVLAGSARSQEPTYRSGGYDDGYRGGYRPVRGGYDDACGYRNRPVFDEYGRKVGVQRVSAC